MDILALVDPVVVYGSLFALISAIALGLSMNFAFNRLEDDDVLINAFFANKKTISVKSKKKTAKSSNPTPNANPSKPATPSKPESKNRDKARDQLSNHHHVEYDPDPVIIDSSTKEKNGTRAKTRRRSILLNRDEVPLIVKEVNAEPRVEFKPKIQPKDELELLHAKRNQQENKSKKKSTGDGHHHVKLALDPLVIGDNGSVNKPQSRATARRSSILHNREEVPLVLKDENIESRTEFMPKFKPKDELELLHAKQGDLGKKSKDDRSLVYTEVEENAQPDPHFEKKLTPEPERNLSKNQKSGKTTVSFPPSSEDLGQLVKETAVEKIVASILHTSLSKDDKKILSVKLNECGISSGESDRSSSKVAELQNALDNEKKLSAGSFQTIRELHEKLAALDLRNKSLMETEKQLNQAVQKSRSELSSRYQEFQKMQQRVQQLTEENKSLRQLLPSTEELSQLRLQLQSVQKQLSNTENVNKDLSVKISNTEDAYRKADMKYVECKALSDELCQKLVKTEKMFNESQNRAHSAEIDLRNLRDHLRNKDLEIKELQNEILTATHAAKESHSVSSKEDNSRILQLESTVNELSSTLSQKQKDNDELVIQLTQTRAELGKAKLLKSHTNGSTEADNERQKSANLEEKLYKVEQEVEALKSKNDDLRKKNWSLADQLEKQEAATSSVVILEAQLDKMSSEVHDLKAVNKSLKESNIELHEKLDHLQSSVSLQEDFKKEVHVLQRLLSEKDESIRKLENQLAEEHEKLAATELECRQLISSLATIDSKQKSHLGHLERQLSLYEYKIADLEAALNDQKNGLQYAKRGKEDLSNGTSSGGHESENETCLPQRELAEKMLDKRELFKCQQILQEKDDTISNLERKLAETSDLYTKTASADVWEFVNVRDLPSTKRALSENNISYDIQSSELLNQLDSTRRRLRRATSRSRLLTQQLVLEMSKSGSFEDFSSTV